MDEELLLQILYTLKQIDRKLEKLTMDKPEEVIEEKPTETISEAPAVSEKSSYEIYAELRDLKGYTDYRVSKITGIETAAFSNWKNGRYTPKTNKLMAIGALFGVTPDYFFKEEKSADPVYDRFRKLCIKKGVNNSQAAVRAGIAKSCISDWKAGRYRPKVDKLQKLADYFGVNISYFYEDEK